MTSQLRVAIAGCHRMLDTLNRGHNWANAFSRVKETKIVAVFDKGEETRTEFKHVWREFWEDIPSYDDYEKMLVETKPDIVCVTTSQKMHADQIETAIQLGVRGIACEKPLSTSLEESDRIISICRENNVPIAYLLDRRWMKQHRKIRNIIKDGAIGNVVSVVGFGSPNLINHGCHWYDMALGLAGDVEPVWLSGHIDDISDEPSDSRKILDPPGRLVTQLEDGAFIHIIPEGPKVGFNVTGSEGGLIASQDFRKAYYWREDEAKQIHLSLPTEKEEWPAGPAAINDLVTSILKGQRTSCDIDEARRATEIGFAVHASNKLNGAKVQLPLKERNTKIESFPWGNE
tara:strand:+ start:1352 stop:2386 length:1035 start_codon:yes stop_codon:yes gene_type:complete